LNCPPRPRSSWSNRAAACSRSPATASCCSRRRSSAASPTTRRSTPSWS